MDTPTITEPQTKPLMLTLSWSAAILPVATFMLTLLIAPGYVSIFFTSTTGVYLLIFAVIWELLGSYLLFRDTDKPISVSYITIYMLVIGFFTVPLMLLPTIGPGILALLQAFKSMAP